MPKTSKFNLKEWFTLKEAAASLNNDFEETIAASDILQFAYDGLLNLSIRFSEPETAIPYKFICHDNDKEDFRTELIDVNQAIDHVSAHLELFKLESLELEKHFSSLIGSDLAHKILDFIQNQSVFTEAQRKDCLQELEGSLPFCPITTNNAIILENGNIYKPVSLKNNLTQLFGTYDLAMLGNERLDVEFMFCKELGINPPQLICIEGFFVFSTDRQFLYNVQAKSRELNNPLYYPAGGIDNFNAADFICTRDNLNKFRLNELSASTNLPFYELPPALRLSNAAFSRFWSNADPIQTDTHPTNTSVIDWLTKNGINPTKAKQIAEIIRPDWAAKGRRAEK